MSAHRGNKNPKYTHGMTNSPEYKAWNNMLSRCSNSNHPRYKDWGGRNIKVSTDWLKFENFYKDMGKKPTSKHTLERRDNSIGYSKYNCYWATTAEQALNRRSNVHITYNGETMTMKEWANHLGMNPVTISARFRRGYSVEKALERRLHAGTK